MPKKKPRFGPIPPAKGPPPLRKLPFDQKHKFESKPLKFRHFR